MWQNVESNQDNVTESSAHNLWTRLCASVRICAKYIDLYRFYFHAQKCGKHWKAACYRPDCAAKAYFSTATAVPHIKCG